jgi:hypothetical protein
MQAVYLTTIMWLLSGFIRRLSAQSKDFMNGHGRQKNTGMEAEGRFWNTSRRRVFINVLLQSSNYM